ncbi:hypothetical protein F4677DRAFT_404966 [Hypoxylon crocopeplum]|nr:hypothetical protein F4677DRAFT_404966 [Hypoxylon crocopeplum]
MADPERDLVSEDLPSSLDDNVAGLLASTSGGFSSESIDSGGSSNHRGALASPSIGVSASHREEILRTQISLTTSGSGSQVDDGQAHEPRSDINDKGKTPMRVGENLSIRTYSDSAETSNPSLRSATQATDISSTAENPRNIEISTTSSVDPVDEIGSENDFQPETKPVSSQPNRPKDLGVTSEDRNQRTTSPESSLASKQKQKQKASLERDPELRSTQSAPTASGSGTIGGAEIAGFRPLQYGDLGWEKSADRPPRKLPIRFKDAVGRKYVFPWEKAKTWAGMERLIRSCFIHVDVIGPHVNKGHYDLSACLPFSAGGGSGIAAQETSQQGDVLYPPSTTLDGWAGEAQTGDTSNEAAVPQAPTPPPAAPSTPLQQSTAIILPELWEDLIEPGMTIIMTMWPIDLPPPPPPPPPPPQLPPHYHGAQAGFTAGFGEAPFATGFGDGGRGRGRGRGGGRGIAPLPPPPPLGWMIAETSRSSFRGKTRKRQDGL